MTVLFMVKTMSQPFSYQLTDSIQLLALLSSLSAASLHFSNGVIAFDLYRSLRSYYPEYHGFSACKHHHFVKAGVRGRWRGAVRDTFALDPP